MPRNNPNERFSVSLPASLAQAVKAEADRNYDSNLSAALAAAIEQWVADAAIRAEGMDAMRAYQTEYGEFTAQERNAARAQVAAEMGWPTSDLRLNKHRQTT